MLLLKVGARAKEYCTLLSQNQGSEFLFGKEQDHEYFRLYVFCSNNSTVLL